MTERETKLEKNIKRMRAFRKEVTKTKESARQLLIDAGNYTKSGRVRTVHR